MRKSKRVARKLPYIARLLDSLFALGSIFLLTGFIFLFHIYPTVPDSFLVYLLVVLALASVRGLYAALLASILAFFSFDFLFIAPVYSFTVAKFNDVLTLVVFLITAIITSQFASALRQRAEDASRRERETRLLYDIVRATNREDDIGQQLTILACSIVEMCSSWGIQDCAFLLANSEGLFTLQASACQPVERIVLSSAENSLIHWVQLHARPVDVQLYTLIAQQFNQASLLLEADKREAASLVRCYVRLLPLITEQEVIGIMRLSIKEDARCFPLEHHLDTEHELYNSMHDTQDGSQNLFFSAFVEQAVTMIEQARLRRETLQVKLLQQTDALRSALLSSVSHDLRTPLSTIKTSATSLLQENVAWDEDARRGFAAAIERESDRLNGLVENLLDMSRIEAGALHLEKVWYPLDELIHDVLERLHLRLAGRIITQNIPDDLPPVELDAVQINQVITNIIENVVNHTPSNSPIDISIQLEEKQLCVSIADRGPGIAESEQERIFDKFYRVPSSPCTTSYSRGSGLGLAICRAFVEAHNGHIRVESRTGGGAIFHFTLPFSEIEDDYEQT